MSAFGDVVINEVQSANDKTLTATNTRTSGTPGIDGHSDWGYTLNYAYVLRPTSGGKGVDLVVFHKGLILSFGPAPTK